MADEAKHVAGHSSVQHPSVMLSSIFFFIYNYFAKILAVKESGEHSPTTECVRSRSQLFLHASGENLLVRQSTICDILLL